MKESTTEIDPDDVSSLFIAKDHYACDEAYPCCEEETFVHQEGKAGFGGESRYC